MQKIVRVPGGIKSYLESPECLVNSETRRCPFCRDNHRLRLHGWYERQALFPDPEESVKLPIRRLLCARQGRTVSLLPDFCLPRRQHGPAILALFLWGLLRGRRLLEALRQVRGDVPCHAVAQSLRDGFLRRASLIRAYLARLHPRAIDPPVEIPKAYRLLASLFFGLLEGHPTAEASFTFHGLAFHRRFGVGLT